MFTILKFGFLKKLHEFELDKKINTYQQLPSKDLLTKAGGKEKVCKSSWRDDIIYTLMSERDDYRSDFRVLLL